MEQTTTVPVQAPVRRLGLFAPFVGPLMGNRLICLVLASFGTVQVAAAWLHLHLMPCPLMSATHVPCPGCGLSRACAALLQGDWARWLTMHAFAPFFLLAIGLFWVGGLAPAGVRQKLARGTAALECRTALPVLLLLTLILYWLVRLLYAPTGFARLMAG